MAVPARVWLILVSAALFVSSIGFIVAGARVSQRAPAPDATVALAPAASVRQVMNGMVIPASTVIYESVTTDVTVEGIKEVFPRNDDEWANVATNAAMLIEAGNLMLMEGRAVDRDQWVAMTRAYMDASRRALKAAEQKSTEGILDAGSMLNETCDKCHERYQRR